jgi:hypothetical protein
MQKKSRVSAICDKIGRLLFGLLHWVEQKTLVWQCQLFLATNQLDD